MIIVSFTTIPERLSEHLPERCIESILNQSVKPDYIVLNVPEVSRKGKQYPYPKNLEQFASVVVQFGVKDLGPITKLVPTLDFIKDKKIESALIILVDDDCVYQPSMIENLANAKNKNPHELVIGTSGRIKCKNKLEPMGIISQPVYNRQFSYNYSTRSTYAYVDIIETFAGVMYDYSLFKD